MREEKWGGEIRRLSHILMVMAIVIFSLVLTALNVLLDWEKWTIPLLIAFAGLCLWMHIAQILDEKTRIYMFGMVLITDMFYYCVNIDTIYDCSPVVILLLVIFSMTQERMLERICLLAGVFAMLMQMFMIHTDDVFLMEPSDIIRTIWHLIVVILAGIITTRLAVIIQKMEEWYIERLNVLEADNKSASDFLANVSHEIRTPVNAVIGLTDVSIENETDPKIRENLEYVEEAGKRVGEQISDILDYSEIDMGKLTVNMEEYMPASILNDLCTRLRAYMDPAVELIIDVDASVPAVMRTDVAKLKRILWHLIINGIKYTKEGGIYVRITALKQDYGVNLSIVVTDTGVGMSAEELEKVCNRFYQSDSGRTRSTNGLGLGLSIVSGFVSKLHGFMSIESEPDKGTTVRVSIPQEVVDYSECMSVKDRSALNLAAFLHFEKYSNPAVRDFYNSMVRNIVMGFHLTMHRVDNPEDLKELMRNTKLTHLFVAEEEYESAPDYIEAIAGDVLVVVVADQGFNLPAGSRARLMPKPFYCFPVVSVLNTMPGDVDEQVGRIKTKGVRALVVDDEPMNLIVATNIFNRYGMQVDTAASGMESVEKCLSNDYDIVFMDHMMPQMDGVEAMKRIRADAATSKKEFPIVALTANAVSSAKEMFLREGFDDFVSKPIDIVEFERVLRRVLPASTVYFETPGISEVKKPATSDAGRVNSDDRIKETGTVSKEKEAIEVTKMTEVSQSDADSASSPASDAVGKYGKLTSLGIDTGKGLYYCQHDEGFYTTLLLQYVSEADEKREGMLKNMSLDGLKDYAVAAHTLKSTSKMIGAIDFAEEAKALEDAAKGGDLTYINEHTDEVLKKFDVIIKGISEACSDAEVGGDL